MARKETVDTTSGEIVETAAMTAEEIAESFSGNAPARIDDQVLRDVSSFEDALALAEQINGTIKDVSEVLGTGFFPVDKSDLVDKPLLLIQWRFNDGTWGSFVSAFGYTKDGQKFILNDGSSGVCQELLNYTYETGNSGGLYAPRGLSLSEYPTCAECGRPRKPSDVTCPNERCGDVSERRAQGATFYLNTQPV